MPSCSSELRRARPLLGTLVEIRASGATAALPGAVDAAFAAIARIERLMSFHDAASDVSRLNRDAHRNPVAVASETWDVLAAAARFSQASHGAFDVTVARQLVAWGYLPAPSSAPDVDAEGKPPSYGDVTLLPDHQVAYQAPLLIDLGGIAKGYAVDRACDALEAHGISAYVVNAGGDLRVGSTPETIHVRHPAAPGRLLPLATLAGAAVATSSSYFAAKHWRGRTVHPLVVPGTGNAARPGVSVSVIAGDCLTSDALTKVVTLLGDSAAPVLRRFDAEACVLNEAGAFQFIGEATSEIASHLRTPETSWN